MALYTSYFAKQLALRPEAAQQQATDAANLEGERTIHQSVARRTVDLAGPLSNWFEVGKTIAVKLFCFESALAHLAVNVSNNRCDRAAAHCATCGWLPTCCCFLLAEAVAHPAPPGYPCPRFHPWLSAPPAAALCLRSPAGFQLHHQVRTAGAQ